MMVLSGRSIKLLQSPTLLLLWLVLCQARGTTGVKNITSVLARQIRSVDFPVGSATGIFFALAVPIDLPEKSVAVAMYFEANYFLPDLESTHHFDQYVVRRSIKRKIVYDILENNLERAGLPGRMCLLQTICEAANQPLTSNGLIGDILHIILTPSTTYDENLSTEFSIAETTKNCSAQYNCPISLLNLIIHERN